MFYGSDCFKFMFNPSCSGVRGILPGLVQKIRGELSYTVVLHCCSTLLSYTVVQAATVSLNPPYLLAVKGMEPIFHTFSSQTGENIFTVLGTRVICTRGVTVSDPMTSQSFKGTCAFPHPYIAGLIAPTHT